MKYQKVKSYFRKILEDVNNPIKRYFDTFMIALIAVSISILVIGKSENIPQWIINFDLYFITSIFAFEYILRVWISDILIKSENKDEKPYISILKAKLLYMISLPALIDFIAIFPEFRIIRLFKLYHYMHGASSLFEALLKKRFEFIFLGYMLLGITFTLGSIFYLLEYGVNQSINSYLDGIYWALVTISTVGYGDITPVTEIGKVVSMFGIIFGVAMISFVTSVMVSAFSERFTQLQNQDSIREVNKLKNVVIINGYGYLGSTIAKKLKKHKVYEPVIIESQESKVNIALEENHRVIYADGSSERVIKELFLQKNIIAMLTLTSSDINNIYFILNAKSINSQAVIYSRINHIDLYPQYKATGANGIIEPYEAIDKKVFIYLKKYIDHYKQEIIFFGYTYKNRRICEMLNYYSIEITIYEIDKKRYQDAKDDGYKNIILVDRENIPIIDNTIVVCAMIEESLNVYYSITLRANGFKNQIVVLTDSKDNNRKLILSGADKIFDIYEESATQFLWMIENITNKKG